MKHQMIECIMPFIVLHTSIFRFQKKFWYFMFFKQLSFEWGVLELRLMLRQHQTRKDLLVAQKQNHAAVLWSGGCNGLSYQFIRWWDNLTPRTIWHLGQFDTDHARRTIWHRGQFDTIINFIFLQLFGPKIWLEIYWLPLSIFLTENYPV